MFDRKREPAEPAKTAAELRAELEAKVAERAQAQKRLEEEKLRRTDLLALDASDAEIAEHAAVILSAERACAKLDLAIRELKPRIDQASAGEHSGRLAELEALGRAVAERVPARLDRILQLGEQLAAEYDGLLEDKETTRRIVVETRALGRKLQLPDPEVADPRRHTNFGPSSCVSTIKHPFEGRTLWPRSQPLRAPRKKAGS